MCKVKDNCAPDACIANLPNSKLITETWKIIDIKSIMKKGLLLEDIEEPGMNWVNSEEGWREIFRPGSAIKKSRPDAGERHQADKRGEP